jgi:hypothetical protein
MGKKAWEDLDRRRNPEKYQKREQEREREMKEFLKKIGVDDSEENEGEPSPSPFNIPSHASQQEKDRMSPKRKPDRIVGNDFRFEDRLEKYQPTSAIENRKLVTPVETRDDPFHEDKLISEDMRPPKDAYAFHEKEIGSEEDTHPPKDAYAFQKKAIGSKGEKLVRSLHSKKEMIILYEILSKPKSMR